MLLFRFKFLCILSFYNKSKEAIAQGADINYSSELPVRENIGRAKNISESDYISEFEYIEKEIDNELEEAVERAKEG